MTSEVRPPDTPEPLVVAESGAAIDANAPLARRAAKGMAWVAAGRLSAQTVQFASTIVLARLLLPSDYGLTAIIWVFIGFAALFGDLGLGSALVQTRQLTERLATTAFWINAIAGVFLTVLLVALAYPVSLIYGHPRVAPLLAIASCTFAFSLTMVPTAVLERALRFRAMAIIDVATNSLGLATTIACAAAGLGPYSLVAGPLVTTVAATVAGFTVSRWRPRGRPSREAAGELWGFGKHLTGFNIINFWARNADSLLLGRFASTTSLGLYNRAYNLMMMPVGQVGGVIGRVLLPVLARVRDDQERLTRAYLRVLRATCTVFLPILYGLAACSTTFVAVAFGSRWDGMAPLLVALAITGAAQVPVATTGSLCQAVGRPDLLFRWGAVSSVLTVAAIVIGLPWGTHGVALAYLIRTYLFLPVSFIPITRASGISLRTLLAAVFRPFLCAAAMAGAVALIGYWLGDHAADAITLFTQIAAGAVIYLGLMFAVDRPAFHDSVTILFRRSSPATELA